jgi:hypothetical protein
MGGLLSIESKKRLAAIKLRQSLREEQEGKQELSSRHRTEAEAKSKELGIALKDIPTFPSITEYLSYNPTVEKPKVIYSEKIKLPAVQEHIKSDVQQNSAFELWGLDIKISRINKKIQLTHLESLSSLILNLGRKELTPSDIPILEEGDDIVIHDWDLRINGYNLFSQNNYLILYFKTHKIEVKISFT